VGEAIGQLALYMLALYRSGCLGRALETFHNLRELMIDQLGIEPSTRLRRLHHAMLAGTPALDEPQTEWSATARQDEELAVPAAGRGQ
jgi:DNA-binding SARP family transcriptional activator